MQIKLPLFVDTKAWCCVYREPEKTRDFVLLSSGCMTMELLATTFNM